MTGIKEAKERELKEAEDAQRILEAFKQKYAVEGVQCSGVVHYDSTNQRYYNMIRNNLSIMVDDTGTIKDAILWHDLKGYETKLEYAKPGTNSGIPVNKRTQRLEITVEAALELLKTSLDGHVS